MKIICVGMNYAKHNEELKHTLTQIQGVKVGMPQSPVEQGGITLFLKPDTALTRPDWPFFVPDWSEQIEYETELVVRINRLGKSIPERFAHRYYEAYCGQQWLRLSEMPGKNVQDLHFEMQLNGETRQVGWTGDMIHTVNQIIAYASQFYLLKTGDLIFTGTPAGVGRVKEGDLITAQLEGIDVLNCRCK